MAFYDLTREERTAAIAVIETRLTAAFSASAAIETVAAYFAHEDTYICKATYLAIGRIYFNLENLQEAVVKILEVFFQKDDFKTRQTVINAAGEIGKKQFEVVQHFFDKGLFDPHHSPRNAVIGSIKKMGEVNPAPVLAWAKKYLQHEDKEIRREICHGIELRGRKYPQDILPLLKELQYDTTARVRKTLVHVIGQIAYKKGCLPTVVAHLRGWDNRQLVSDALEEIIDVHHRYRNFSFFTQEEARLYIMEQFASR